MADQDTKAIILRTAERLFAEHGFSATSLRTIVGEAGVNLAAVNYHFGSKDGLIREVLARRMIPLAKERQRLLEECEARSSDRKSLAVEDVIRALVAPALQLSRDRDKGGPTYMRLMGRIFSEPEASWQRMLDEMLGETIQRFTAAFQQALPRLPAVDFYWRLHFAVGAMIYTLCETRRICALSQGECDPDDVEAITQQLVVFLAAGMKAPTRLDQSKEEGKS